jgi:nucleolar MIF4G domain-containing protein 1
VDFVGLAAAHRLNTELRRSVFTAIMGSTGVGDAFERLEMLSALEKKDGKDKDALRVLIHCCGAERSYNKFYAELAEKICDRGRSMRFAFEFALWESIGRITMAREGASRNRRVRNFGRLLGHLLGSGSIRLYALRNAPDFETCTGALCELYRTAFGSLFGDEASLDSAKRAMTALANENGVDAPAFRASLSLFLMRDMYGSCSGSVRNVLAECVRSLEI